MVGVTTPLGAVAAIIGIDTRSIWRMGGQERKETTFELREDPKLEPQDKQ
jgi:hypothetical protein